ncbi:MAG TPA: PorV/PorQ family protein [Gemmatimonadales bacterium]|nr:PorV/PorQ family protein [Gemmatimonadales bacterium]
MRRNRFDRWADRRIGGWLLVTAVLLSAHPTIRLFAQEPPLNAGALFLVFPVGAQAVGMGQTATAAAGRGEAAFWNPAGLATLSDDEFALHSASLVAGRSNVLGAYFPSRGIGVVGAAVYLVDYGDLERTDQNGNTIARIAPRNFELLASYATNLTGSVVFGINYKLVQFRVDCSGDCRDFPTGSGATHALDVGGQFNVGAGPGGPLRIGIAVRNVGFRLQVQNNAQADPLPTRLAVGAQYEVRLRPTMGGNSLDQAFDVRFAADVDSPWGQVGQSETRLGLDVGYQKLVRIRAGYAFVQDGLSGPSIGLGIESGSLGVDLARAFLAGSDLQVENPTFFSFRVAF